MKKITILFLFSCLVHINLYSQNYNYKNLSTKDFYIKLNSEIDILLLDTRIYKDYQKERINKALYAGSKNELIKIVKTLNKKYPIFVYCDHGDRSITVCKILHDEYNFSNIYNLEKGIIDWLKQDYPIDKTKIKRHK